jgi:arginine decarboxylase
MNNEITGKIPLITGLKAYIDQENAIYHMPGHKQGRGFPQWLQELLIKMDLTEVDGTDNLAHPNGIIAEAERCAAKAFGAAYTFFLTQGATIGNHAMILATCQRGDKLMISRNSHVSIINAMMLFGVEPVWIQPEFNIAAERLAPTSVEAVKAALLKQPTVKGALITTPSYYGEAAPLKEIAKVLHANGKWLLVDQAHGAHFAFSPYFPDDAGKCGADIWVHSAHKTLPVLTQGAYLHIADDQLKQRVNQALRALHTSSPSYMIMASLDYARAVMEQSGKNEFEQLYQTIASWQAHVNRETNIFAIPFGKTRDFSRIVLDVKAAGWEGTQWQTHLRHHQISCEMADHRYCVLIATIFDDVSWLKRLLSICRETPKKTDEMQKINTELMQRVTSILPKQAMGVNVAYLENKTTVALEQAQDRICGQAIGLYPPGIPLVCPGEWIDKEIIDIIKRSRQSGIDVFGLDGEKAVVISGDRRNKHE